MKKQMPYSTPEGYFEDLRQRLSAIPGKQQAGPWQKFSPYIALAAVFATAFIVGSVLVNRTTSPAASQEEVIEYLIDSDVTLAQMEAAIYQLD